MGNTPLSLTVTRELPVDPEAERAILGAALQSPDVLPRVIAAGLVDGSDFYYVTHTYIYDAMLALIERGVPIDVVTVVDQLQSDGRYDDVGGVVYLTELTQYSHPTLAAHYADIVTKRARQRRLIRLGAELSSLAYNSDAQPDDVITEMERMLKVERDASPVRMRLGKRVQDLMTMQFPERTWIVPGLIPEGLGIFAGAPKIGKSFLALGVALAAASGGRALGQLPATASDVLYLVLEDGERRLQERLMLMGETAHSVPTRFEYDDQSNRVDNGLIDQLRGWLEERSGNGRGRFIIIDTLAMIKPIRNVFRSVYDEDYGGVVELRKLAQEYQAAIWLVHHTRKVDAKDVFDLINGSYGLSGAVETMLVMRRSDGVQLSTTGKDASSKTYQLRFDTETRQWILVGDVEPVAEGLTPLRQKVMGLLADNRLTPREIAEAMGRPYNNVVQHLKGMRDDGLLESDDGFYQIANDHI